MARVDVIMPQMGESIAEGTLLRYLKKVGDPVKKDEDILEISTDKVDATVPSPVEGTLVEMVVESIPLMVSEGTAAAAKVRLTPSALDAALVAFMWLEGVGSRSENLALFDQITGTNLGATVNTAMKKIMNRLTKLETDLEQV